MNKFIEKYWWIGGFIFISGCTGTLISAMAHADKTITFCFGICTFVGWIIAIIIAGVHDIETEYWI